MACNRGCRPQVVEIRVEGVVDSSLESHFLGGPDLRRCGNGREEASGQSVENGCCNGKPDEQPSVRATRTESCQAIGGDHCESQGGQKDGRQKSENTLEEDHTDRNSRRLSRSNGCRLVKGLH